MKYKNEKLVLDPTRELLMIGNYVEIKDLINVDEIVIIPLEYFELFKVNDKDFVCAECISLVYADNLTLDYKEQIMDDINLMVLTTYDVLRITNATELTLEVFVDYGNDSKETYNINFKN